MNKLYVEGFISKCADCNINPEKLVKMAAGMPMSIGGKLLNKAVAKPSLLQRAGSMMAKHPVATGVGGAATLGAGALGLEGLGHYLTNDAPMEEARHDAQIAGKAAPGALQMGRSMVDPVIRSTGNKLDAIPHDKKKPAKGFMQPFKGPLDTEEVAPKMPVGRDSTGNPI